MDKRKFAYKLTQILDDFRIFVTPEVFIINDILIIRFQRGNYRIERAYSEEQLINYPHEIIEKELNSDLRALYKES